MEFILRNENHNLGWAAAVHSFGYFIFGGAQHVHQLDGRRLLPFLHNNHHPLKRHHHDADDGLD